MTIEQWADAQLSADLERLIGSGEGETIEFKREFPPKAHVLAKTIAAFASTQGGQILLGVGDDGAVLGVAGAENAKTRDDLGRRIVGVSLTIDPPVRPQIRWAWTQECAVLVVGVEKGPEPLYYTEGRPYIRHHAVSRPASSSEVKAAMQLSPSPAATTANGASELSDLSHVLAKILRWCDTDSQMRTLKPWGNEWSADAERYASTLRELSVSDWAVKSHADTALGVLADHLDDVAQFRHYSGRGSDFDDLNVVVRDTAADVMREFVEPHSISEDDQRAVFSAFIQRGRQLTLMWKRAGADIFDGRVEKAMEDSFVIGKQIAECSYFKLTLVAEDTRVDLRRIGLGFVKLRSSRLYMDGGASLQRVVDMANGLTTEFNAELLDFPRPIRE